MYEVILRVVHDTFGLHSKDDLTAGHAPRSRWGSMVSTQPTIRWSTSPLQR